MRVIDELEGFVSSQLNTIKTCLIMTKLEAKLAGLSVYPLLINLSMLFVILINIWLMAMGLLSYALIQIFESIVTVALIVFLLNMICFGILVKRVLGNLKKMSFEKTRTYLNTKNRGNA